MCDVEATQGRKGQLKEGHTQGGAAIVQLTTEVKRPRESTNEVQKFLLRAAQRHNQAHSFKLLVNDGREDVGTALLIEFSSSR